MIQLENKLYTSTEVADILGVSLRSVYRYIEEDKLVPEVKTATGRHRFTKQNIMDFLYPGQTEGEVSQKAKTEEAPVKKQVKKVIVKEEAEEGVEEDKPEVVEASKKARVQSQEEKAEKAEKIQKEEEKFYEPVSEKVVEKEETVDWLAKFREAARKFENAAPAAPTPKNIEKEETIFTAKEEPKINKYYYRSKLGGLKDIAQNIDKTSKNSGMDYAFTMSAGLSLHSPIKPFSLLHAYVRTKDKDFFERVLMLTPSDEENGQLCLILSDDSKIYNSSMQMHGLTVVSKEKLLNDIREMDADGGLVKEAESILG